MSDVKHVKLGEKAQSFYDAVTEVKVLPGKVVELNIRQLRSRKIRSALQGGHLVYTAPAHTEADLQKMKEEQDAVQLTSLVKKFKDSHGLGKTPEALVKMFTLDDLKLIATKEYQLELEKDETKQTLVESIIAELEEGE